MYSYRITKYNPKKRDTNDTYLGNEWTSISDIGKSYDNKIFNVDEYLNIEDKYIKGILLVLNSLNIESLTVTSVEKYGEIDSNLLDSNMINTYQKIREGIDLNINDIIIACKLILREQIWFKLSYKKELFIHFGYDYYIYFVSNNKELNVITKIEELGLYVEVYNTPYI